MVRPRAGRPDLAQERAQVAQRAERARAASGAESWGVAAPRKRASSAGFHRICAWRAFPCVNAERRRCISSSTVALAREHRPCAVGSGERVEQRVEQPRFELTARPARGRPASVISADAVLALTCGHCRPRRTARCGRQPRWRCASAASRCGDACGLPCRPLTNSASSAGDDAVGLGQVADQPEGHFTGMSQVGQHVAPARRPDSPMSDSEVAQASCPGRDVETVGAGATCRLRAERHRARMPAAPAGAVRREPPPAQPQSSQDDLIQSVADALQYISYYHPVDYIRTLPPPTSARNRRRPGCHGADPDQLAHVRRRPPPDLPGHRHRHRVPRSRHGRALG